MIARLAALALLLACACYEDEAARSHTDYITFSSPGVYREQFVDAVIASGDFAFDMLDENARYVWMMGAGPRAGFLPGMDHDQAPYPHGMAPRKHHPITLRYDKRWWQQFVGGAWRSIGVEVDKESRLRASSSYLPDTVPLWCPGDLSCVTWPTAVLDEQVKCWAWNERGVAKRVDRYSCMAWHPRSHYEIKGCDDCTIPAVNHPSYSSP